MNNPKSKYYLFSFLGELSTRLVYLISFPGFCGRQMDLPSLLEESWERHLLHCAFTH